jgi:hypothetical protein
MFEQQAAARTPRQTAWLIYSGCLAQIFIRALLGDTAAGAISDTHAMPLDWSIGS